MPAQLINISAKNLGQLALPAFCPRCFWLQLKCNFKMPYQIFPGIFSSIDSYSKKITWKYWEKYNKVPPWFDPFGEFTEPVKVPHFSKYSIIDKEANVQLRGVPDDIFRAADNSYFIADYKTAKFTENQDALLPLYKIQLNSYALTPYVVASSRLFPSFPAQPSFSPFRVASYNRGHPPQANFRPKVLSSTQRILDFGCWIYRNINDDID